MTLTLANLLDEPSLGLRSLVTPDGCGELEVAGAHSIEIARPMRYMRPGWVLLSNGVRLRGRPDEQRQLVAELDHGGITALGFGLGEFFQRTPPAILDEARKRQLPLFVIEGPTPFRDIISFVGEAALDRSVYHLRRAVAINDELMDCLVSPDADGAIVRHLATALRGTAAVFSPTGEVRSLAGVADADDLWAFCRRAKTLEQIGDGGRSAWVAPVGVDGSPCAWLVFAPRSPQPERLVRTAIHTAQRLLELSERGRGSATAALGAIKAELLAAVLAGPDAVGPSVKGRLAAVGVTLQTPAHVAVFGPCEKGWKDREEAEAALARNLGWLGTPHLLAPRDEYLVVLVEAGPEAIRGLREDLAREGFSCQVGIGGPVLAVEQVHDSFHDACLAAAELRRASTDPGALGADELSLAGVLARQHRGDDVHRRAERLIGALRTQPVLYDTLLAYLDCDLDVRTAAERLHLHPNSLRYRLRRIESIIGRRFESIADVADLYLATTLDRADAASDASGTLVA